MYMSINIHKYKVDIYVYDKIPHEPTMILPVQIQNYKVFNLISSILHLQFFFLALKNIGDNRCRILCHYSDTLSFIIHTIVSELQHYYLTNINIKANQLYFCVWGYMCSPFSYSFLKLYSSCTLWECHYYIRHSFLLTFS